METLMVDSVQNSLRLFMHRNAIFLCERLCAEFPTEINLQLLATCYLQNGKAYCAYQILKGTRMPHSRYLFAMSCFQMNLLQEAEAALCPANEPNAEVPDGAAGHYLLGLIYRYIGRRGLAIEHLMQALALDPLLWAAYDEMCVLGAVEDANEYFNDMAAQHIQKQYLLTSVDSIPRQSKQFLVNNAREIPSVPPSVTIAKVPASNNGTSNFSQFNTPPAATQLSGVAPPPLCRNVHVSFNVANNDMATKSNNIAVQAPRRKVLDEGKLRKVSGRLFPDSVPRRSTRLSAEAIAVASSNATQVAANGNSHTSTKFLGGFASSSSSKVNAASSRSLTFKKGHSWISESFDEGSENIILI